MELRPGRGDSAIFEQVFFEGAYELHSLPRWAEIEELGRTAPNPIILDLGANVGFAALALHWQFPRARILAVEPEAGNFAQLCRNTAGIENIVPLQAAVAASDGWAQIANPEGPSPGFRTVASGDGGAGAVPALTVENLWRQAVQGQDESTPLLIKMDVEGAERELFPPHCEWLDRTPLLIVEPHDWMAPNESVSHDLLAALATRGGDVIVRGEHLICWRRAAEQPVRGVRKAVASASAVS